jgi:hypothetical protein
MPHSSTLQLDTDPLCRLSAVAKTSSLGIGAIGIGASTFTNLKSNVHLNLTTASEAFSHNYQQMSRNQPGSLRQ